MNIDEVKRKKVLKVKTLYDFEFFIRYHFYNQFQKKFIISKHHKKIIDTLTKVVKGELKNVIINLPPRYGKTEIVVKQFMAWVFALNEQAKFIHLSYSDSLALDNSESVKNVILSDTYQELYNVQISKDSKAKNKWYTSKGGGVLARSSAGQVTGFGAGSTTIEHHEDVHDKMHSFGGAIIIDDPIKPDDANSDVIRDKINNKFETTIRSRVNSRETPIIIIMQRLHEEDLSGYLIGLEPNDWYVLSLPAIDENGKALWIDKHSIEELEKLRKANQIVFETQYMQNPKPSQGLVFAKESLKYFTGEVPKHDFTCSFVDIADTGEDSHSVVISRNVGQLIYIDDVLFTKLGTTENVQMTADILNKHKPQWTRVESNMGGGMYIQLLSKYYKGQLLSVKSKSNKITRILTLEGFIKEFCRFRSDYTVGSDYDKFMTELTRFLRTGESKHDDAPDSLHGLVNMIRRFYPQIYKDFIVLGKEEE